MNREEIQQCIPHRPPYLWVDEVLQISENHIHARKDIDPALELFTGHFPDFPVLPGVLLCEAAFQAAAILISRNSPAQDGKVPVVTRQNNTKFRRMVRPGETIDIKVDLTERLANAFFFTGKVSVEGETALRLDFACAITDFN